MNADKRNPADPIENLAIGKIIEVDGTHVIAELDPGLTELSRVYAGETYPIGQFGSIVRIHFGRRLLYALVGRLRMKAEYESERGFASQASADERVVEARMRPAPRSWSSSGALQRIPCRNRRCISRPSRSCGPSTGTRGERIFSSASTLGRAVRLALLT